MAQLRAVGVQRCRTCSVAVATCSFCGEATSFVDRVIEALSGWRYFALRVSASTAAFERGDPWQRADEHTRGEVREWLCCPACLAESGEARISNYLEDPAAMRPAPAYVRVQGLSGETLSEKYT
jgi:hypothetical protein